ncbi:DUF262 domain-containing protein [Microlunatus elymi]|uniref:DUF262 domain-containing protein n=1 Tax=Microlunatus elymi TaxID=2596828 RepID=A0A516PUJ8_9ACTN|nr:DUF262 domain-containing protein [Microlunatus elymi]QDP94876.1 DUF262 domain-containing protein [Microlunatus elymi]
MVRMFGHHPWTVGDLVAGVDRGSVRLPDIQRPFVWPNAKVRDLIDSMYRGYPVGELMFWTNRDSAHTRPIGAEVKTQDASYQVVDGQQRLTSLYAAIKGLQVWREDYSRELISIGFNPLTGRFEVPTPIVRRSVEWIPDLKSVFDDPINARYDYLKRLRSDQARTVDMEVERAAEIAITRLYQLLSYEFQVVQVKEDVDREVVADIFVRINSEGVNLSSADFILTWLSVFWEEGRAQLEKWARNSRFTPREVTTIDREHEPQAPKCSWTPSNPFMTFHPGQILRVAIAVGLNRARLADAYNALRGRDPRTRTIHPERRDIELTKLKDGQAQSLNPLHWDEFLKVMERAGFRNKSMITSTSTILYTYALWLIGRNRFGVPVDELREVMARWFFMSQVTGRYTSSPETRMQEDLNRLDGQAETSAEFTKTLTSQIEAALPADWWAVTLPDALDTSSVKSPAWVAYVAALNILDADVLLATSKVKDWINPNRTTVKGIEKHHLFPKAYLRDQLGLRSVRKINQVANFALVEWSDNIAISDDPPNKYWPAEVAAKNLDENRRWRQEQWHALPVDWTMLGYEEFVNQRRNLIAAVTYEGFKRLTDANYEPDLSRPDADTDGGLNPLLLPTLENLVTAGWLPAGTLLEPVDDASSNTAEITEDAYIKVGDHTCETVDIAAREDNVDVESGWDYWRARLDTEDEPILLSELRIRAAHAGITTAPAD